MDPGVLGAPQSPAQPRVLLVEDNDAAGRGLSKLLEVHGFAVVSVTTGTEALALLESGPPPDFLLTDMRLPDLDGREVARAARQLDPPPRVGLITGWDYDPSESVQWGIEWYFPKPLSVQDLLAKLQTPRTDPQSPA